MSIFTVLKNICVKAETSIEAEIEALENSSATKELWTKIKALIAQVESVGAQQLLSIAETGLTGLATAVATGGNVGAAIAAAASTAEAAALIEARGDAKNALYGILSAAVAEIQALEAPAPQPAPDSAA